MRQAKEALQSTVHFFVARGSVAFTIAHPLTGNSTDAVCNHT